MRQVLGMVSEPSLEILDQIMDSVVDDELWPKKRDKAVDILKEYHQRGARIIIISVAYELAVKIFASRIDAERILGIGTPVAITDAGLELDEKLNSREIKLERLRTLIGDQQIDVALGDTFADIPLLESAQEAIAVFPDKTLRKMALERGWKVID